MAAPKAASLNALITGASSGIGKALTLLLAQEGTHVFAVARRGELLAEIASSAGGNVTAVTADVASSEGRATILKAVEGKGQSLDFLVHNAGVLGPVGTPMQAVSEADMRHVMDVNFFGPLFLTQALLAHMTPSTGRILQVSSGAAHTAVSGMNVYCTSKAGLFFLYRALKQEIEAGISPENPAGGEGPPRVLIGSVRPGVVDTGIQSGMRGGDTSKFPAAATWQAKFEGMNPESTGAAEARPPPTDALDTPENTARFMSWLLQETSGEEFTASEWEIRETHHHHRWCPGVSAPEEAGEK